MTGNPKQHPDFYDTQVLVAMADPNENKPDGSALVVDDEEYLGRTIGRILASRLHFTHDKIVICTSVRDAISKLQGGQSPSVIISDINMPDQTGDALYDHLKANSPQLIPRALFMTGGGNGTGSLEAFIDKMGLRQKCIYKPFNMAEFAGRVSQILESQKQD